MTAFVVANDIHRANTLRNKLTKKPEVYIIKRNISKINTLHAFVPKFSTP